jgi:Putative zinc- or iron-chelating domain
MVTRSCSGCSLCCKLLPMRHDSARVFRIHEAIPKMIEAGWARPDEFDGMIADFDKPAGERCPHQRHGKGCAIYARRPFGCRMWNCKWLGDPEGTADLSRPDRAGYVIDVMPDFIKFGSIPNARMRITTRACVPISIAKARSR